MKKQYLIYYPSTGCFMGYDKKDGSFYSHITSVDGCQKWDTKGEIYSLREKHLEYWNSHKLELHETVLTSKQTSF